MCFVLNDKEIEKVFYLKLTSTTQLICMSKVANHSGIILMLRKHCKPKH